MLEQTVSVDSLEAGDLDFCFNGPLKPAVLRAPGPSSGEKTAGTAAESGALGGHLRMIMPMRDPSAEA